MSRVPSARIRGRKVGECAARYRISNLCRPASVRARFVNTFTNVLANIAQAQILQTEFRYYVQLLPVYVSLARVGFLMSREDFNYGREHFSFVVLHCCSVRLLAVEVHLTPWIHQTAILSTRSALGRAADQKLLACSKAMKPIIRNLRIITPQDLHLRPLLSPCSLPCPLGAPCAGNKPRRFRPAAAAQEQNLFRC